MDINKYSAKDKLKNIGLRGMSDLDESDIYEVLSKARLLKISAAAGERHNFLKSKSIAVVHAKSLPFDFASVFAAVSEAGGNVFCVDAQSFKGNLKYLSFELLGADVAAVIFYGLDEQLLTSFCESTDLPFINAGNDECNLVSSATSLFTLWETKKKLGGLKIVIPQTKRSESINSFVLGAIKCGCDVKLSQSAEVPVDDFVTERAMQYGEFGYIEKPELAADTDAVFCDFEAEPDNESLKGLLASIKNDGTFLVVHPEKAKEDVLEIMSAQDHNIMLQTSNKKHIIKAILNLFINYK